MAAKKSGSDKPASDGNRGSEQSRRRNSPAFPYEADENLHDTYEGYDEDRSSGDPRHEQDFDINENDINNKWGESRNQNKEK